jgi:hypothetical protein
MPSVSFRRLPHIQHPRAAGLQDEDFLRWYMELVGLCNGRLHDLLCSMPPAGRTVHAIVMDALSAEALSVAEKLPGLAPMPASHLEVPVLQDPESETYRAMVSMGIRWYRSDDFIVNTF